jgi:hypothetical protein
MSVYDGVTTARMVRGHVETVLYGGKRHDLEDRAAGLIKLLLTMEQVLESDGSIADLIMEAVIHAYDSTEDHDRNLEAFIAQTRRQAAKELAKAKKG